MMDLFRVMYNGYIFQWQPGWQCQTGSSVIKNGWEREIFESVNEWFLHLSIIVPDKHGRHGKQVR